MARPLKSESIAKFLATKARPELAALYSPNMEVQVNVAQGDGERKGGGEFAGRKGTQWTNGVETWFMLRIPRNANTEPEDNDSEITYDLAKHAEGIGLTGWDWKNKVSKWVAFDFDAMTGHSDAHQRKISDTELENVRVAASQIPWVTVLKSTSGNGLHLYVHLDDIPTQTHTEHAALARSIIDKMAAITGFNFKSKVDACGGVMWVWHQKFDKAGGLAGEGLKTIKVGEKLKDIPANWRDFVRVTSGVRVQNIPSFVAEDKINEFEQVCSQHPRVPLDETHKQLIEFLNKSGVCWWWDADHHMLVTHTYGLKMAHDKFSYRGVFETISEGKDLGDQNCYAFPMRSGAWVVRRHGVGVQESKTWERDQNGRAKCYLNQEPDLKSMAKVFDGAEDENGSFVFTTAKAAQDAANRLGAELNLPEHMLGRKAALKAHRDGRLMFTIDKNSDDKDSDWSGWVEKKGRWTKVLSVYLSTSIKETADFDDIIRHLVCDTGDAGWALFSDSQWKDEPISHVKLALTAMGHNPKEIGSIMGKSVLNRWYLVNEPFQNEYLGDRRWNRDAAQFSMAESADADGLHYPTWIGMFNHLGSGLDVAVLLSKWCVDNNIKTGGEYLITWVSALFQHPTEPLPYLFFYGPQGSGKSIIHEALALLMTRGVVRADSALISQSGFNGELESAVLCVVEETDLRTNKSQAYNRIKDWVTSRTINIHKKGVTPYSAINSTHWIQCANEGENCPIFPGDTRITMCFVDALPAGTHIPKTEFLAKLRKEAPDFLRYVKHLDLPTVTDRLFIPTIETDDKAKAAKVNQTDLDLFIEENCYHVDGELILLGEFYDRFREHIDRDRWPHWSKTKITRHMPNWVVKGRLMRDGAKHYYGNISWHPRRPDQPVKPKVVSVGDTIMEEGQKT
jgi:hypothetical protein